MTRSYVYIAVARSFCQAGGDNSAAFAHVDDCR